MEQPFHHLTLPVKCRDTLLCAWGAVPLAALRKSQIPAPPASLITEISPGISSWAFPLALRPCSSSSLSWGSHNPMSVLETPNPNQAAQQAETELMFILAVSILPNSSCDLPPAKALLLYLHVWIGLGALTPELRHFCCCSCSNSILPDVMGEQPASRSESGHYFTFTSLL